jgi:hypothetical protein
LIRLNTLQSQVEETKFDGRSEKRSFLHYSLESKSCSIYHPATKKVKVTQNVVFNKGDTDLNLGMILKDVELSKGKQIVVYLDVNKEISQTSRP